MTTSIRASVKITPKIKDTFYSFSYEEERTVSPDADLEEERMKLWDDVYNEVANQVNETVASS